MTKIVLIFLGAGLGGVLRYAVAGWVQGAFGATFPAGTLVVNVLGCLAIGFLGAAFAGPVLIGEGYRIAIVIGVLGGFTTFSTFGWETMTLAGDRQWLLAGANVVLSVVVGLFGVWTGTRLAGWAFGV